MEFQGSLPINSPSVPCSIPIKGGLFPGKQIFIQGFVPHGAEKFQVDLKSSQRASGEDRVFHFNPRWLSGDTEIVINTCTFDSWGEEERHGQCIAQGSPFDLRIEVEEGSYRIFLNGNQLCEYAHRGPVESIDELCIEGSVEIAQIRFSPGTLRTPGSPYVGQIPGGPRSDRLVIVEGVMTGDKFSINLRPDPQADAGGTNCFHFNPRVSEGTVVRNTCNADEWGEEERGGDFPFGVGQPFTVSMLLQDDSIKVGVNGNFHSEYQNRMPLNMCTFLAVDGDVDIQSIRYE